MLNGRKRREMRKIANDYGDSQFYWFYNIDNQRKVWEFGYNCIGGFVVLATLEKCFDINKAVDFYASEIKINDDIEKFTDFHERPLHEAQDIVVNTIKEILSLKIKETREYEYYLYLIPKDTENTRREIR